MRWRVRKCQGCQDRTDGRGVRRYTYTLCILAVAHTARQDSACRVCCLVFRVTLSLSERRSNRLAT
jgi:hypothetical protein